MRLFTLSSYKRNTLFLNASLLSAAPIAVYTLPRKKEKIAYNFVFFFSKCL